MAERFSDMLRDRRRNMGLSIQQVANTIKIRPQIIEYFETGDFDAMPPRGYAQGMISSYARFLGLNPRTVVGAYFDELTEYEHGGDFGSGRLRGPVSDPNVQSDTSKGRFMLVDSRITPSPPPSRYGQRPQQAGYVSESRSSHEPQSVSNLRAPGYRGARRGPSGPEGDRAQGGGAYPRGPRGARGGMDSAPQRERGRSSAARGPRGARGGGEPRRSPARRGRDASAAARPGRSRGGSRPSGSRRPSARSSVFGTLDPRFIMGGVGLLVVLLVLVIMLVRGCASQPSGSSAQTGGSSQDQSQQASSSDSSSSSSSDSSASDSSSGDSSATDGSATSSSSATDTSQADTATEAKVKVSLAKGKTSWIEIRLDGGLVYADTPVGPWSKTYTVTQSIEISANNPGDVTVTRDGTKVRYGQRTSGVGRITITVGKQSGSESSADANASSNASNASNAGASSSTGTATGSSSSANASESKSSDTSSSDSGTDSTGTA